MENTQNFLLMAGEILRALAAGSLGLFAGAMLTEAGVLVPYWRSIDSDDFHRWYRANATRLVGFFGPLTWLAGTTALAAALVSQWSGDDGRVPAFAAAGLALVVVALFPIYFKHANAGFVAGDASNESLRQELARWAAWHRVRTGISVGAFVAAIMASR